MADTLLGNLVWRITGDTKDFDSKVGASEKTLTGFSAKSAIGIAAIGVGVGVALAKIGAFVKESLKVSIAAQEQISKYGAVFAGLGDQAEASAQQFADSFDLAGASAKEMLSNTGNLLQGMGATREESLALSLQVNTLATDLSSFTNNQGGAQAASDALTKALLGERESMKSLGIAILESDVQLRVAKNGKADYTGTALKMAKAEATLQLITEQSKNAIGDYARTQDSAANSQKRAAESTKELQVQIGSYLNPAVTLTSNLWTKIATALGIVVSEQVKLRDAKNAEEKGIATAEQELLILEDKKEKLRIISGLVGGPVVLSAISLAEKLTGENLKLEQTYDKQIEAITRKANAEKMAAEFQSKANKDALAGADRAAKQAEIDTKNAEIAAEKYRTAREKVLGVLDAERTEYELIQIQIDELSNTKWAKGELENDRLKAITILKDKQKEIIDEELDAKLTAQQAEYESNFAYMKEEADKKNKAWEDENGNIEENKSLWDGWEENASARMEKIYTIGMDSIMTGFSDIGESIAQGSLDWKVFAKSGLNALAAIIEAMGHELLAQAAKSVAFSWSTFGASLVGVAPALGGAAAAYTASGLIKGYAGAFEQGGIVPGTSYTGDKMVASVNSGEEILRRDDPRNSLNGGGSSTIVIQLDGRTIAQSTVNLVNNGEYLIKGGSII